MAYVPPKFKDKNGNVIEGDEATNPNYFCLLSLPTPKLLS
jgi:hypothetical protein